MQVNKLLNIFNNTQAELEAEKKAARERIEAKIKAEKLRRMEAGQKKIKDRMVEKLNKK